MTDDNLQLPFFVYGSLLPGQANAFLWGDAVVLQQVAMLAYGRLYSLGEYPVLIENGGGPVKGMVMTVRTDLYAEVLARLDALEAYFPEQPDASDYLRVMREVTLQEGATSGSGGITVTAWVYIGQANFTPHLPLVPDGDWQAYVTIGGTAVRDIVTK